MFIVLKFIFIFFIGSTIGWILEIFYNKIDTRKWVNPGFLIGPYLPIYGFGLCVLTLIYNIFANSSLNPIIIILLMGLAMTIIELIGGLCFITWGNIKLWDYSDRWGNYKGIICPFFTLIWIVISAIYYYFLSPCIFKCLNWYDNNLSFSFLLGVLFGLILIDFLYSTQIFVKIRNQAKEYQIEVKYEELKSYIKDFQKLKKEKYSFILPFRYINSLKDYFINYKKDIENANKSKNR